MRRLVGGGGQRDARDGRVALVQGRELQVFRAEIVAPLRDAMRFVDGEQGQLAGFVERIEHGQRAVEQQALGGDVDEVERAVEDRLFDGLRRAPVERRIEAGGLDAELDQRVDLVLHQRDQRRDDDGAAGAEQGGNLVAQALAAAGRHQHQRVAATGHMVDDLGLRAAEGGVAEDVAQDGQRAGCGRHRFRAGFQGGWLRASGFRRPRPGIRRAPRASRP